MHCIGRVCMGSIVSHYTAPGSMSKSINNVFIPQFTPSNQVRCKNVTSNIGDYASLMALLRRVLGEPSHSM